MDGKVQVQEDVAGRYKDRILLLLNRLKLTDDAPYARLHVRSCCVKIDGSAGHILAPRREKDAQT
jgi:hypothetical protein